MEENNANVKDVDMSKFVKSQYLQYAEEVIMARALVAIDGFKPVQRRVLYGMHMLGLDKKNAKYLKSTKVVGHIMGDYHPHGDGSIYEAMVNMAEANERLNVPYVDGKGGFGKVYTEVGASSPRYTEAKLLPICEEIMDGINEDAVDMIPTFDESSTEPALLPVKYPTVLVSTTDGIAVGMSSSLPRYSLNGVCKATIKILNNQAKCAEDIVDELGVPEFTTGGFLHASHEDLVNLVKTGKGKFKLSGTVTPYKSRIVINSIPYNTTSEKIIRDVTDHSKDELKEIVEIKDVTDRKGYKMVVDIRKSANARDVIKKMARYTDLRTSISFRTRVVVGNSCDEIGVYDLLIKWIEFRENCIKRQYTYRLNSLLDREHLLEVWEKISGSLDEVIDIIKTSKDEPSASFRLKSRFGIDDKQVDYLFDIRLVQLTRTRLEKGLKELANVRDKIKETRPVVEDVANRYKLMVEQLSEIMQKYGKGNKTTLADPIVEEEVEEPKVSEDIVTVYITRSGKVKRLNSVAYGRDNLGTTGDPEIKRWNIKNNDYLLVFTRKGEVHKVFVDDIDAGRGEAKESLAAKLGLESFKEIIYVDNAGDYSGHFNIIYQTGRGYRVDYSKASGKRKKYISLYEECNPGSCIITREDWLFIITAKNKAAYADLRNVGIYGGRLAFKIARIDLKDRIVAIKPVSQIEHFDKIDISKYTKGYTIKVSEIDEVMGLTLKSKEELLGLTQGEDQEEDIDTTEDKDDAENYEQEPDDDLEATAAYVRSLL